MRKKTKNLAGRQEADVAKPATSASLVIMVKRQRGNKYKKPFGFRRFAQRFFILDQMDY